VGSAVNIAARVCSQARAGELLVTDTVRSLTRTFLPVRFEPRGSPRLKGIAEPIALYRAVPAAAGATAIGRSAPRQRPSIRALGAAAVLAIVLLGGGLAGTMLLLGQRAPAATGPSAQPSLPAGASVAPASATPGQSPVSASS